MLSRSIGYTTKMAEGGGSSAGGRAKASEELRGDWEAAAADAGLKPTTVVLYPLAAAGDYGAMHVPPGRSPQRWANEFAYTDADRAALSELADRHVLVVDESLAAPKRLLVLRHEAEHVAQHDDSAAAGEVALRLAVALPSGASWLYLAMPHERDADAAATALGRARGIKASSDELTGSDRFLFAAPWEPADRDSLPVRLVAFTLFYPDDFDAACSSSQYWPYVDPVALIDEMIDGGSRARTELRGLFAGFLERIVDHGITDAEWKAMTKEERNEVTDDLRARVLAAEVEAVGKLRELGEF